MKALLKVMVFALVVGMTMVACKKKNEPAKQPTNYLVGKTFDHGRTPEQDPNTYLFTRLAFTSNTQGVITYGIKEEDRAESATGDFTYTYEGNKLVVTRSKVKYKKTRKTDKGLTTTEELEDDKDYNENKVITLIVDEKAGTLTEANPKEGQKPYVLTLKK